jgi:hypothetical protein
VLGLAVLAVFCSELSATDASSGAEIRGIGYPSIAIPSLLFAVLRAVISIFSLERISPFPELAVVNTITMLH